MRKEGAEVISILENLKEKLKEKGYKLTPQRRATLDIIMNHQGKHLSTEEIYDLVKTKCPEIGLATVYRTLQLLDELNLITKINFDDGCGRYELKNHIDDHYHHHLICLQCGTVIEVEVDLMESLEEEIEENYNFQISDHKVKFLGLCSKCK